MARFCTAVLFCGLIFFTTHFPAARAQGLPQTATPLPTPAPVNRIVQPPFALELYFSELPQGGVGILRVIGEGQRSLTVRAFEREIAGFASGDAHYALLAAGMTQAARQYTLTAEVEDTRGLIHLLAASFRVTVGPFVTTRIILPDWRVDLLDPEIEQVESERLRALVSGETAPVWGSLMLPVQYRLTSPYGQYRNFNDVYRTRHSGWDFRADVGTPVAAMADGRVAFTGWLDLRGKYALIDHGGGLYSGYAHLSQIHVVPGQPARVGQIIGMSGNSGRSTAPHLHWDVALQGQWIDGAELVKMWLPRP